MRSILVSFVMISLVAGSAFADKKKKGGDDAPPPAAEPEAPKKKNKNKEAAAEPAAPAAPAPAEPGKGTLKPGQGVGVHQCLGSSNNINVDATSKTTVGVATCRGAVERALMDKGRCKAKGEKVKYSWQFADTTGEHEFTCR